MIKTLPQPIQLNVCGLKWSCCLQIGRTESTQACRWVAQRSVVDEVPVQLFVALSKGTVITDVPLRFERYGGDVLHLTGCGSWGLLSGTPPRNMQSWRVGTQFRGTVSAQPESKLFLDLAPGLRWQMLDLPYISLPFSVSSNY